MQNPAPIKTFHQRGGRLTANNAALIERMWPEYGVDLADGPLDLAALFSPAVPVVLELGSGMGEAAVAMAAAEPDIGILAAEVHTPGVASLLRACETAGVRNVRVFNGDGIDLLTSMIAPASLAGIRVYFPDPWPKTRHNKRRLVRSELVSLAASRIEPGGFFHAATDWADYAEQMLEVLTAEPMLTNEFEGFAPRPASRPMTRYEKRGIRFGHDVRDLVFRRTT